MKYAEMAKHIEYWVSFATFLIVIIFISSRH